jgi:hypothetical protein
LKILIDAIERADEVEADLTWTVLKRKDEKFGIKRKLVCLARVYNLDVEKVLSEAEQDETGRILDTPNRVEVHEALMRNLD